MLKEKMKTQYRSLVIFSKVLIYLGGISFLIFILKWYPNDIQSTMHNGGFMLPFLIIVLGIFSLFISSIVKKQFDYVESILTKQEESNERPIILEYSEEEMLEKVKRVDKDYIQNLFTLYGLLIVIYIYTKLINISSSSSITFLLILAIVVFIMFLIMKSYRKYIILTQGQQIKFFNDFILYEDKILVIHDEVSSFLKVEYNASSNKLVFSFAQNEGFNFFRVKANDFNIPLNKESEIQSILKLYNKD